MLSPGNADAFRTRVGLWARLAWPWMACVALLSAGCSIFMRDTPAPILTQATSTGDPATKAATLVVFLPGRGGSMADFEQQGFAEILRAARVQADVIAVDAHLGYYYKRTVIDRLRADVIEPARTRGYRRIVLVGVSLGGLGALLYERDRPGAVDAIVLLAPYLGDKAGLFERIDVAGGPRAWAIGRDPTEGGVEEMVWTFLGQRATALPPTWLLFGEEDRLAPGHRRLMTLLPSTRVIRRSGGHDWPTWRMLWQEVCLNSDLFAAEKGR
jgi:pimeloyl-ACP methyl ester carboxylesterase